MLGRVTYLINCVWDGVTCGLHMNREQRGRTCTHSLMTDLESIGHGAGVGWAGEAVQLDGPGVEGQGHLLWLHGA